MAWPSTSVAVGDLIQASQLNLLPIQIADSTLAAAASSFDFTSVASQFAHLLIIVQARGDTAATVTSLSCRFNNDSGSNYDVFEIDGSGSTVSGAEGLAGTSLNVGGVPAASSSSNLPASELIWIPNYAAATFEKVAISINAYKLSTTTGNLFAKMKTLAWRSTAAINRVTLFPLAGNFVTGSRATIYGLA